MCGICGIVYADPARPVNPELLEAMRDVLRHRGPDDAGVWRDHGVGLGHRRLSIIDLSRAGQQPMASEDGSIRVTYNGEIYNYREIRRRLSQQGHVLRTQTDTEVLLHLYQERGPDLVQHLRGMFAFALWDARTRQMLLVRDRLGIKPLYYATSPAGDLVFGSEIKAILASGLVQPRLQPAALSEYLANRYTTGSTTLYAGVNRLLPGHVAIWRDGDLRVRQYWSLPTSLDAGDGRSEASWIDEFRSRFVESVRLHMISDAPIGVFLSGGIDSSAIAALMAREAAAPIRTFSVGFAERAADELPYAREFAATLHADHYEVVVSREEFFAAAPRLVWHEDEPLAFPSSVPLYFVSKLAAGSVKVVLTGEGSDELLAGYGKYWRTLYNWRLAQAYARVPAGLRALVRGAVERLPSTWYTQKLRRTFLYLPPSLQSLYLENFGVFDATSQRPLLAPEFVAEVVAEAGAFDPFAGHRRIWGELDRLPLLSRLLAMDMRSYLPELLMKQDQMSMAASIESRVPFLDHELVEFGMRLPDSLKLRGVTTKRVLRQAMGSLLPASVLRRPKMGFPTPLARWLRNECEDLLQQVLLSGRARGRGVFDPGAVQSLVRAHRMGTADHTERLWALLNVEWWFQECMDAAPAPAPARSAAVTPTA